MKDLPPIPASLRQCAALQPLLFALEGRKQSDPLRQAYLGTLAQNLACMKRLEPVLEAFAQAQIQFQPLKGALFVDLLYEGDPGLRPMSDVDLLVPGHALSQAHTLLLDLGFSALGERHLRFEPRFTHHNIYRRAPLVIELHYKLWHEIGLDADPAPFFEHQVELNFRGHPIRIGRPELQMYVVLVHAATHGLAHTPLWMVDALLLARKYPLDWQWIADLATPRRASRALAAATRYLDRFFPGIVPVLGNRNGRDVLLDEILARTPISFTSHALSLLLRALLTERLTDLPLLFGSKVWLRTLEALSWDRTRPDPSASTATASSR